MGNGWCFAKVNNKLAEIFFEKRKGKLVFFGHCYVKSTDYKTKRDKKWLDSDIQRYNFIYRNKGLTNLEIGKYLGLASRTINIRMHECLAEK